MKTDKLTNEKAISIIHDYANTNTSKNKDELLTYLLAIIPYKYIKQAIKQLDIKY